MNAAKVEPVRTNWIGIVLAVAVSFLALLAGVFGSIYTDDIKNAVPFCWFDHSAKSRCNGPISFHAVVFWTTSLSATALFFWAQYDSDRRRKAEEAQSENHRRIAAEELRGRTEELKELIRTVPSEDFLIAFKDLFRQCIDAKAAVEAEEFPNAEIVEQGIRIVCRGVAALAQRFDRQSAEVLYAVNIMLFRPAESLTDEEVLNLKPRLRFVTPETGAKTLRGVLDLQLKLSTSTKGERHEPDPSLVPLALPIPISERIERTGKWRVLPGAPLAFCRNKPDGYEDSQTLASWCESDGTFDDGVVEDVRDYFHAHSNAIRSLIALPLTGLGDTDRIGVLNIHSELPGLLNAQRLDRQFVPLIAPFQAILIDLLTLLLSLESRHVAETS